MLMLVFSAAPGVRADSVTLNGSSIPLAGVTIQAIQSGKVFYRDARGVRQERSLDDINSLGFDSLPQLDVAEREIASSPDASDRGITLLLRALIKADADLQKLWINSRIARMHESAHHFTLAAGHLAQTIALSDDPYWKSRVPIGPPDEPTYAAAKEALDNVQAAQRKVKSLELKAVLDSLIAQIQPIHDRLLKTHTGQPIATGSTVSGISRNELLKDDAAPLPAATKPALSPSTTAGSAKPGRSQSPPEAPSTADPDSPAAIDSMLARKQYADALVRCERLLASPDGRDGAHLLYQHGMALVNSKRSEDAAVSFTRLAVLYPQSSDAAAALIQTALIHRDTWHDTATAKRLLQRAVETAMALNQEVQVQLARELLKDL